MSIVAENVRDTWSSRFAFLMAAIGSSVGLGNFWRFPYLAGENGGGAFVAVYLLSILLIILPLLIAEIVIGRRGGASAFGSMVNVVREAGASRLWVVIGLMGIIAGYTILTSYSVIGGWVVDYILRSAQGFFVGVDAESAAGIFNDLLADPGGLMFWHAAFMLLTVMIVGAGVTAGIERVVVVLMPALFVMLIALVIYGAFTADFARGAAFLLVPDWSKLTWDGVLKAIGQGFFSVGVGVGLMLTFGSYMKKDQPIASSALIIVLCDTAVAILAGLLIFPLVFANGLEPGAGPGLMFVTLPLAFGQMPGGQFVATAFFILILIAAVTSSISMLELPVSWTDDRKRISRWASASLFGAAAWLIGIGSVLSFNAWSTFYPLAFIPAFETKTIFYIKDYLTDTFMLPLGGILIALFVGWSMKTVHVKEELGASGVLFNLWIWMIRIPAPAAIAWVLYAKLAG